MSIQDDGVPAEPRAHLDLQTNWVFVLGSRDALLVLKALGGRPWASDEERLAAVELGDRLTLQRAKVANDRLRAHDRAVERMNAAREARGAQPLEP